MDSSGATISLAHLSFFGIGDKAISGGERSVLDAVEIHVEEARIGVAAKDSSHVTLTSAAFSSTVRLALTAYNKKPEFGPGTIVADSIRIAEPARRVLVQDGSSIKVNGIAASTEPLNVEELYRAGVLGN